MTLGTTLLPMEWNAEKPMIATEARPLDSMANVLSGLTGMTWNSRLIRVMHWTSDEALLELLSSRRKIVGKQIAGCVEQMELTRSSESCAKTSSYRRWGRCSDSRN